MKYDDKGIMPLEATPNSYILIYYNYEYQHGGLANLFVNMRQYRGCMKSTSIFIFRFVSDD
jgi:hypothetical protein